MSTSMTPISFIPGHLYRRTELHKQFGGQRQGGISTPAKAPFVMLIIQAYDYPPLAQRALDAARRYVMGYARVLWLFSKQRLQDRASPLLIHIGLVGRGCSDEQCEGMKDCSFMVVWITRLNLFNRSFITQCATGVVNFV
jgi:hypothetical protein